MDKVFQPGDLVRVKETTDDANIPADRHGLIIECVQRAHQRVPAYTSIWKVVMTKGKTLRLHEMFLVKVNKE